MLALGVAEEIAWFGTAESSVEQVGEWIDEEGGVARGVVIVDDDGRLRGYASPGLRESVFLADPGQTDPLVDELLPWLRERREDVQLMSYAGDPARAAAFERHGLRHIRSSFTLARPESAGSVPAAAFPEGVSVETYSLGADDEAVHRLIYVDAEWASVPGHAARDLEDWLNVMRPCPSLFVARRDGCPIGWVAGRLLETGRGYINQVAVATSERGRGLGRALLLHAFTDLQSAGARGLSLHVESRNESALGLYRSVGLEVEREWRIYTTVS